MCMIEIQTRILIRVVLSTLPTEPSFQPPVCGISLLQSILLHRWAITIINDCQSLVREAVADSFAFVNTV